MLALYYRWALQFLPASTFYHAHGMYIVSFSNDLIWLRPDLSLAATCFISNRIKGVLEEDWGEDGGWVGRGSDIFPDHSDYFDTHTEHRSFREG